jgi:cytochrome c biogenesis protein CcdA/thiol-disulfide isomerase/thioredoxin
MALLVAFAFLAGLVTVLSPCILPVLPAILSGGVGGGRSRPWGVVTGFVLSFALLTLALSALVKLTGLDPDLLRYLAAALVLAFGLATALPFLRDRFELLASKLLSRNASATRASRAGFLPGLALGLGLGAVWTPCVGPIMASVITLALSRSVDSGAALITLAYALGTALPLFLVMAGGRALLARAPWVSRRSSSIQRAFGFLMIATSVALFTGADRAFSAWVLKVLPNYGSGLTAIEDTKVVRAELAKRGAETQATPAQAVPALKAGASDPFSLSNGAWINTSPLSLASLKGKVVLVDFWTYSCINCVRTLPFLRAWNERYAGAGLVIVGVHSPEFAFERSEANVRRAVAELGVSWPVVQDNAYGIWNAFHNSYWPAHYLFDRSGKLVETRSGEGGYPETEAAIANALGLRAPVLAPPRDAATSGSSGLGPEVLTPETYLGYGRGERLASPEDVKTDAASTYSAPTSLANDRWAFEGPWTVKKEYSESVAGSSLELRYRGARVYLVAGPVQDGEAAKAKVYLDGSPVSSLSIDADRMYEVLEMPSQAGGLARIVFDGPVRVYSFTFG